MTGIRWQNNLLRFGLVPGAEARFVLFGFRPRWASYLDRSTSKHSYGYASSADRPTCFAHHALNSEPFMQHAGLGRSPFPQWDTDAYVKGEEQKHLESLHALLNEVGADLGSMTMEGLKPHIHLVNGEPVDELLRLARTLEVDMVVMGPSSRRGIASLIMGNTAETMFRSLDCSVFVVKPADFVTPVSMEK